MKKIGVLEEIGPSSSSVISNKLYIKAKMLIYARIGRNALNFQKWVAADLK